MNKTISILGCGWLGFPLAEYLITKGYQVKGSTTSEEKLDLLKAKGIDPYLIKASAKKKELSPKKEISKFYESEILYLNIPPGRSRPDVENEYTLEIKNILDQAIGAGMKKIIFISSTGVYPDQNNVVTETHPLATERASGKALIQIENDLQNLAKAEKEIKITILRMAGLVGGNRKAGRFLAGKKNVKNGEAPINLVHLEDCIGVSYEIIRQEKWGEIYNVCADEHPPRAMFYTYQALKENLEPPTFVKQNTTNFKIISNEKVKRELGYPFKHPDPMKF
jgi:nucleoside-diphosphate-sugar epimerase